MINLATAFLRPLAVVALCLFLAACGGDARSSAGTPGTGASSPPTSNFTIGGTVTGLPTSETLTLLNNGANTLTLEAPGPFTFAVPVAFGASYAVTVGTQPLWQSCAVSNGSGAATADVTNVTVACSLDQAVVTTLAGSGTPGAVNGTGAGASFNSPIGVAVDTSGNVYVGDFGNNLIRKITSAGVVTTLAGSGAAGSANGTGAAASFNQPNGVAVDASGNVYVGDTDNNLIRKITPAGVVTTLAGSGAGGSANGTGTAASFLTPRGVAVDASGNVYVADAENNEIRKITPAGVVTTLAGSGTVGSADGTGTAASFNLPEGVAVDTSGNVYVTDTLNNEIRKITPAGVVTTLAGSGTPGSADGTGTAASFDDPIGVAVDASGNVYVGDKVNNKIRRIEPDGVVTTLAGSGVASSVNGTGTAASFNLPAEVAVDLSGNVYVAEEGANEIRKITPVAPQ